MTKIELSGYLLSAFILSSAQAQMINGSTESVVQKEKAVVKVENNMQKTNSTVAETEEETLVEEAPVAMTPEQKAEIDIAAKKSLKQPLKRQNLRERKDFIRAITGAERIQKRRAAMIEGKTEAQAEKEAREVEFPDINPASNVQMEEYIYQKAGLNNEK